MRYTEERIEAALAPYRVRWLEGEPALNSVPSLLADVQHHTPCSSLAVEEENENENENAVQEYSDMKLGTTSIVLYFRQHVSGVSFFPYHYGFIIDGRWFHPGCPDAETIFGSDIRFYEKQNSIYGVEELCGWCAYRYLKDAIDSDQKFHLLYSNCQQIVLKSSVETVLTWSTVFIFFVAVALSGFRVYSQMVILFLLVFSLTIVYSTNNISGYPKWCRHIRWVPTL